MGRLPSDVTEAQLRTLFSEYGVVSDVRAALGPRRQSSGIREDVTVFLVQFRVFWIAQIKGPSAVHLLSMRNAGQLDRIKEISAMREKGERHKG